MFKNCLIKYLFLFLISLFSTYENLNADTLEEILKLTFATNKQLILTRINLESSKRSIEISKSALGIDLSASFNGRRDWDLSNSQNNDSYSNSIIGRYNLFDGNFSKNKVLLAQTSFDISHFSRLELLHDLVQTDRIRSCTLYLSTASIVSKFYCPPFSESR